LVNLRLLDVRVLFARSPIRASIRLRDQRRIFSDATKFTNNEALSAL
jgi:hypothetical protein